MRRFTFFGKGLVHRLNLANAILVSGLVLALCGPLPADDGGAIEEMKLAPCADTCISSRKHADERKKNFGLKKELKVLRGKRDRSGHFRDWKGALIRFDLAAIPGGAEIQEARIFLYHENHEGELLSLHRMEREWTETGATWFEPCKGCEPWWNGWDNGNYGKDATDTQRVRKKGWISWEATGDVRSFLQGAKNNGWFLKSARTWGRDLEAIKFYSKESHHKSRRPYLRVRYRSAIPPLTVKITSPPNGAVLYESPANVNGTVSDPSATITVNGIIPSISGNTFQANLNLTDGANSITVSAEDRYGQKASDRVDVTLVTKGSIAGVIRDSLTKLPLVSAAVTMTDFQNQPYSVLTGADGKYQITGISSGPFSGDVRKEGYQAHIFSGTMMPGQTVPIDADLNPILPLISGISASDISSGSAMINWATDMPAESLVDYGLTSSYGSSSGDSVLKTAHKIALNNLTPDTTYHFRVTSRNEYGFTSSSDDLTFKTLPPSNPITLTITTPGNGDTISRSDVRVEGTVSNALGLETGVTVNGILAQVYGNQFSANHVPLEEGANLITAKATDAKGNTQAVSVEVNAVKAEHYLSITANVDSGIAPLEAVLRVDSDLDLTDASLTYTGPGEAELISREGAEYRFRIASEGSYNFIAQVADPEGRIYEDTLLIMVLSREQIDSLLQGKWDGMKAALASQDPEKAVLNFAPDSQEIYQKQFNALKSFLPEIAEELNRAQINLVEMDNRRAEYEILVERDGVPLSFSLKFIKDQNGLWKIWRY
jgi:hypothetical protein